MPIVAIVILVGGIMAYNIGKDKGYAQAHAEISDNFLIEYKDYILQHKDFLENYKIFEDAYYLYKFGTLDDIVQCKIKGYRIVHDKNTQQRWCQPQQGAAPYIIPTQIQ